MIYVDLWGWAYRYAYHQDPQRRSLLTLYNQAIPWLELNPQKALAMFEQGRNLAEALDEPCWTLFFDYWRCEVYVFYLQDLNSGRDLAVRTIVEVRKPAYAQCPVLARMYRILMDTYVYTDPVGYLPKINETLDYMEKEVLLDDDTHYLMKATRAYIQYVLGNLDQAIKINHEYMAMCENDDFRLAHGHGMLCHYYYRKDDLNTARAHAVEGEIFARRSDQKDTTAMLLAWQAVLSRKLGDENAATRLYRQATTQMAILGSKPSSGYYTALAEFHEAGGESETALKIRQQELTEVVAIGSPYSESETRLRICRLLARMGKPYEEELATARKVAEKLIDPARFNIKVERILKGDYSDKP